jgi:hypothetical protein
VIQIIYASYYAEMGGAGPAPEVKPRLAKADKTSDNVTAFKRPAPQRTKATNGPQGRSNMPVALIFACLVVVYTAFRYLFR